MNKEYIYVREHESYEKYNAIKLGQTTNIPDRESQYITCEIVRGKFIYVYRLSHLKSSKIEKKLKNLFLNDNIRKNGGTEFFRKSISVEDIDYNDRKINKIEQYFIENNINYEKLSDEEIENLNRIQRPSNQDLSDDEENEVIEDVSIKKNNKIKPYPYQEEILQKIDNYYKLSKNNYGRLYLPCGTGKTLIAFWTFYQILKCKSVFIVVPSLYLLTETFETWDNLLKDEKDKTHFILIGSDLDDKNNYINKYNLTTNQEDIINDLSKNESENIIVISTYHSSELLKESCEQLKFVFDLGIFDEAHRTVGQNDRQFTCLLSKDNKICEKRLFMTATEKIYDYQKSKLNKSEIEEKVVSMNDTSIYGDIIHNYSTRQAIEDSKDKNYGLVDYYPVSPLITSVQYNELVKKNEYIDLLTNSYEIEIIVVCLCILKSMNTYKFTHLLIFSNFNDKAKKISEVIKILLENDSNFKNEDVYCNFLCGDNNMNIRKEEVKKFENSKFGIISSAKIFGEGVNIKICDAVCFADNKSSAVDITQYVGRCLRKCEDIKPNKESYVLLPFFYECKNNGNFFDNNTNSPYYKILKVLKTLGDSDDRIQHKFRLLDCYSDIIPGGNGGYRYPIISNKNGKQININEFKEQIVSRIFDRKGNPINRWKKMVRIENKRRYNQGINLIDTKEKCLEFFLNNGINDNPNKNKYTNWVKYCLGNTLFEEIKSKYYYDKKQLTDACKKLNINDFNEYKKLYINDKKLPSPEYINDGFYFVKGKEFNFTALLQKNLNDPGF